MAGDTRAGTHQGPTVSHRARLVSRPGGAGSFDLTNSGAVDLASLHRIGFWTLPNYSMIALSNALEGCRMANYVSGSDAYSWQVLTLDGLSIAASNGLNLAPTRRVFDAGPLDIVFVCG